MCGITGAYHLKENGQFSEAWIIEMTHSLMHRGPDSEGYFSIPNLSMGVRRLILRDSLGGMQPMRSDNSYFSFNGELFSYSVDRAKLIQENVQLKSDSDTEVFFQSLLHYGQNYLSKAKGQFAIALYHNHSLLIARDRFGIIPLYYTIVNDYLIWASEVKSILKCKMIVPKLNPVAVDHVLTNLALGYNESCFENIHLLPPGHCLIATKGRTKLESYIDPNFTIQKNKSKILSTKNPEQSIQKLERVLLSSIEKRLESDFDVGLYLSGGVDSSLIAAMAAIITPVQKRKDLTAYSVQLVDHSDSKEESIYARETSKQLQIRQIIVSISEDDLIEHFAEAVAAAEIPILDHANICLLQLAKAVRLDNKKAVLTGEGADEAFGGYPWQTLAKEQFGTCLTFNGLKKIINLFSTDLSIQKNQIYELFTQGIFFGILSNIRSLFYSNRFKQLLKNSSFSPFPITQIDSKNISTLSRSLALDYQWMLAGHLLIDKGDRVSMTASVEARYPFLDEDVVELASQLPDQWKLSSGQNKWILRKVAEKYLPKETAWRKKHLFRAEPVIHGQKKPLWINKLLSKESIETVGLFDFQLVQKYLQKRLNPSRFSVQDSLIQVGLTGVISTQLLYHLYCENLFDIY